MPVPHTHTHLHWAAGPTSQGGAGSCRPLVGMGSSWSYPCIHPQKADRKEQLSPRSPAQSSPDPMFVKPNIRHATKSTTFISRQRSRASLCNSSDPRLQTHWAAILTILGYERVHWPSDAGRHGPVLGQPSGVPPGQFYCAENLTQRATGLLGLQWWMGPIRRRPETSFACDPGVTS